MVTALQRLKKNHLLLISDKKNSIPEIWQDLLRYYSDLPAVVDKYNNFEFTYKELYDQIQYFASGLQSLGLAKGDHAGLFSENSSRWLIADQAILMAGGINAVRGSQAPVEELFYILEHSESKGLIAENLETINRLTAYLDKHPLEFIICLSGEEISTEFKENYNVYSYNQVITKGKRHSLNPVTLKKDDIATLVYTSGTTGKPKGVMISHGNFLSQLSAYTDVLDMTPGQSALSILPPWHIYERTSEYYLLSRGLTIVYTNVANFKNDMKSYKPHYLITVPRIWEALYSGVQTELKKQPALRRKIVNFFLRAGKTHVKSRRILNNLCLDNLKPSLSSSSIAFLKYYITSIPYKLGEKLIYKKVRAALGGNFRFGISGGGALAGYLEDFYETVGIEILVGYGLTETSPVLTIRKRDYNLKKSAGKPMKHTEIKIVNPENRREVAPLETGLVMVRGPQLMKGYYKDKEATDKILAANGWLNTGDLGWLTHANDLVLTGRNKDIIVLSNGENVEPQPLEDACLTSPYINQIMLVGQDKPHLGALISPNIDSIQDWAKKQSLSYADDSHIYHCPKVQKLLKKELKEQLQKRANSRSFEQVQCLKMLKEPFSMENGLLTQTMKVKKSEVQKKYKDLIEDMFIA